MLLDDGPSELRDGVREDGDNSVPFLEFFVDSVPELEPPFDPFAKADANGFVDHVPECFEQLTGQRGRSITESYSFDRLGITRRQLTCTC